MGQPKALVADDRVGSWLVHSVEVLRQGGCNGVTVVLGAAAGEAERILAGRGADVTYVRASDWADGMGASLRAGLASCAGLPVSTTSLLVHLVDLPDVTADVVRRVVAAGDGAPLLARAGYRGVPGHPVLIGRDHWSPIHDELRGDRGARRYIDRHGARLVEMRDLATGHDVDTPEELGGQPVEGHPYS